MQPTQHSPTIRAAIADLQRRGLILGQHFNAATALELLHDIQAARSMWEQLGRLKASA